MITYVPHEAVDRNKWDTCIAGSSPNLPYGFSWYLDIVSPGWDCLVFEDYRAVMPIPFRRKWHVHYIFKPYFSQQLGIFSSDPPDDKMMEEFIDSIPHKFRYIRTNLNESNKASLPSLTKGNVNHLISIDKNYNEICRKYCSGIW